MKKNKGKEVFYSYLSYNKNFIRNMWPIPFIVFVTLFLWFSGRSKILTILSFVLMIVIVFLQTMRKYIKWKNSGDVKCIK